MTNLRRLFQNGKYNYKPVARCAKQRQNAVLNKAFADNFKNLHQSQLTREVQGVQQIKQLHALKGHKIEFL